MAETNTSYRSWISLLFVGVAAIACYALLTSMHPKIHSCYVKGQVAAVAGNVTTARIRCELKEGSPSSIPPQYLDVKADGSFQGILNIPENALVNFTVEKPGYSADNHSQGLVGNGKVNQLKKTFSITSLTSQLNNNSKPPLVAFNGTSIQHYQLISLEEIQYLRNVALRSSTDLNGGDNLPADHIVLSADVKLKKNKNTFPILFTLKKYGNHGDAYLAGTEEYPWLQSRLTDEANPAVRRVNNSSGH